MSPSIVDELTVEIVGKLGDERLIVGICGAPGAGKSTLAGALCAALNKVRADVAVVVPMDGFHLDNGTLREMGLLHLKGIPATFDAAGYAGLLGQIRAADAEIVQCPAFDRSIESTVADAIQVLPSHRVVLTEGNYLLLEDGDWGAVRPNCDIIYYLDVPVDVLRSRLVARHQAGGKTVEEAIAKVESTDLPNAELVAASKIRADRIIAGSK